MQRFNLFFTLLFTSFWLSAQVPTPGNVQTDSYVFSGATVHIGDGKVVENAIFGIKEGKFDFITTDPTAVSRSTNQIDLGGKHVYPGLIALNSNLGLSEIDAVRATRDFREVGEMNPSVRSIIAYNTCLLYTSPSPRDATLSRMPSSA